MNIENELHLFEDDGTTPKSTGEGAAGGSIGNAGPAFAYGNIGIVKPASLGDTNVAKSPNKPPPGALVCTFIASVNSMNQGISGESRCIG